LFGAIVLLTAVQVVFTYLKAWHEADEIFDYQMQQMALSFHGELGPSIGKRPATKDALEEQFDFVVQVWTAAGALLYQSEPHPGLPMQNRTGFHDAFTADGAWRVFASRTQDRIIQIAQQAEARREMAGELAGQVLLPVVAVIPLLMLAVWVVITRSLRPLEGARRLVALRAANDLFELPLDGLPQEVAPLAAEINHLFARVGALIHSKRAFLTDAAHELRTPLAALLLQVQNARAATDPRAHERALDRLQVGVERATRLVDQLLTGACIEADEVPPGSSVQLDLSLIARDVVVELTPLAEARGVDLGLKVGQAAWIEGHATALASMLRNLVENAVKYAGEGGIVDVSVERHEARIVASVEDNGPGIDPSEYARVFDRFYRGRASRGVGSGLGQPIARPLVEAHGGGRGLGRSDSGGLRVEIELPACEP
jgi:two-component system OmpR family sensor kinase